MLLCTTGHGILIETNNFFSKPKPKSKKQLQAEQRRREKVGASYNKSNSNKNALSSVESRVLGVKQPGLLYYFFVWNTKRVLYVIMYILKKYKKLQGETGRTS